MDETFVRPEFATPPAAAYFKANIELVQFILFVDQITSRADEGRSLALNAIRILGDDKKGSEVQPGNPGRKRLDKFRRLMAEVLLTRGVDNYLAYVTELLALIFKERPETLRSGEEVRVDFILSFDSIDELQEAIAERRVERLAYRGMSDLAEWVEETMAFTLVSDRERLKAIERFVEQRNLIVHHRGVVDRRYIQKVGPGAEKVGDLLQVDQRVAEAVEMMDRAVIEADQRATEKWGLQRLPFSDH